MQRSSARVKELFPLPVLPTTKSVQPNIYVHRQDELTDSNSFTGLNRERNIVQNFRAALV